MPLRRCHGTATDGAAAGGSATGGRPATALPQTKPRSGIDHVGRSPFMDNGAGGAADLAIKIASRKAWRATATFKLLNEY